MQGHTKLSIAGAIASAGGVLAGMPLALHTWNETTFDGFIYLLLALGLGIYRNPRNAAQPPASWIIAVVALAIVSIAAGMQSDVQAVTLLGYALCSICLLYFLLPGIRRADEMWAIIALVFCGVPFWMVAVPILQYLATSISVALLQLSGLSLWQEGFVVSVPNGTFLVDLGCSGFRYVCSAIAIATIYAKTGQLNTAKSLLLVASAACTAILANGIRIAWIIHVGNETEMRSSLVEDHAWLGWVIFALTVVPLCAYLGNRMERSMQIETPRS
ncbi:MAG: exosortase/archaeosortase family protein [Pseudomonadales bacterium]